MPDVVIKEDKLGAIDDLSNIANNSSNTIEFMNKLKEYESRYKEGLLKQKKFTNQKGKKEPNQEVILAGIKRDMRLKKEIEQSEPMTAEELFNATKENNDDNVR